MVGLDDGYGEMQEDFVDVVDGGGGDVDDVDDGSEENVESNSGEHQAVPYIPHEGSMVDNN